MAPDDPAAPPPGATLARSARPDVRTRKKTLSNPSPSSSSADPVQRAPTRTEPARRRFGRSWRPGRPAYCRSRGGSSRARPSASRQKPSAWIARPSGSSKWNSLGWMPRHRGSRSHGSHSDACFHSATSASLAPFAGERSAALPLQVRKGKSRSARIPLRIPSRTCHREDLEAERGGTSWAT